jgi:hypothetical protein
VLAAAAVAAMAAACTPAPAPPPPPPAPVEDVVRVPASIDRSGTRDVSAAFATFLAGVPDGSVVELPRNGRYRLEAGLVVSGRRDLTLVGNGATVFATTPGHVSRASVAIDDSSGIVVRDLVVDGANPFAGRGDAAFRADKHGQHGFRIASSTDVTLDGVTVTDPYGDFVYLGQSSETRLRPGGGPWTDGVVIRNSRFTRNGRQGISLVAARNVLIEGNSISEVRRSTFDFEPLAARAGVEDVVVRDNRIGVGRLLFVAAEGAGPVDDVTIERNRLTGQAMGVQMRDLAGGIRRNWRVLDNTSDVVAGSGNGAAMEFYRVDGLLVRGNRQPFDPRRGMLGIKAFAACNVVVTGNDFPGSLGQGRTEGAC